MATATSKTFSSYFNVSIVAFPIGGILFGLLNWRFSEQKYLRAEKPETNLECPNVGSSLRKRPSWIGLAVFSLLSFIIGVFCLFQSNPHAGVPKRDELIVTKGKLAWIQKYKYGTRFGLLGVAENFEYPSKAKGMNIVRGSLESAGDEIISVEYEKGTHGPISSDKHYHNIWVLNVGTRQIRSFEETVSSWERDNRLTPWLGVAMFLSSFYLAFSARRNFQTSEQL